MLAGLAFISSEHPAAHPDVAQGAELIVALSHMRTPNDLVLAANVPEIHVSA